MAVGKVSDADFEADSNILKFRRIDPGGHFTEQ